MILGLMTDLYGPPAIAAVLLIGITYIFVACLITRLFDERLGS